MALSGHDDGEWDESNNGSMGAAFWLLVSGIVAVAFVAWWMVKT